MKGNQMSLFYVYTYVGETQIFASYQLKLLETVLKFYETMHVSNQNAKQFNVYFGVHILISFNMNEWQ